MITTEKVEFSWRVSPVVRQYDVLRSNELAEPKRNTTIRITFVVNKVSVSAITSARARNVERNALKKSTRIPFY